ncbi:AraC family transcriptional regulator N-terminal domain-containing protein [Rhizobium sp. 21-4511-3d]
MEKIAQLAELIDRHAGTDGSFDTALPRVGIIRSSAKTEPIHTMYEPSCCIVAQGRKRAVVGDRVHVYDSAHYLVVGVDLPVIGAVVEASADRPYLCMRVQLDRGMLAELMPAADGKASESAAAGVSASTPELLDAAVRMLQLLDAPEDAGILAPMIEREMLYRLIRGPQAPLLRQIANRESRLNQIGRAVDFIRKNFSEPFAIEHLASVAGMSASTFYEHFKSVMAMSPLQFRTQLRLQEARRLMVTEGLTAAEAGFRVGYDSPSQFSRDYVRVHSVPPRRDVERMRVVAG